MNIGDEVTIGYSGQHWIITGFALAGPGSKTRGQKAILTRQFSEQGGTVKTRWPINGLRKVKK